jgi:tetratricopeptide (TPR) repeat protein
METQNDLESLVRRLVENPHDQAAIAAAHRSGQSDPRVYATLLERVGKDTREPSLASHWYTEAANVWVTSLNDAHQGARALMNAIERDPTDAVPAERLADLYREKGDAKALVALLERRARALAPLATDDAELTLALVAIHEELGRLWSEPPLSNPGKALDHYRKAIEYDRKSQYAIYALRELLKATGRYAEAIPYFDMELQLVSDPERRLALFLDEAEVCKSAGQEEQAALALRQALYLMPEDPTLRQQLATLVLELARAQRPVDLNLRHEAADLFVSLAEEFAEHGMAYALCSLELVPTHDRGMQLALHYGRQFGRSAEVAPFAAAYIAGNAAGPLVAEALEVAGDLVGQVVLVAAPLASQELPLAVEPPRRMGGAKSPAESLVEAAQQLIQKNRRNEAAQKYKEVLAIEPANGEAIEYLQTFLRRTRRFGELRALLLTAAGADGVTYQQRASWLREVANLSESQLQDVEGALSVWRQLSELGATDEAGAQLRRLLERAGRWEEVAELLRTQAEQQSDLEARIAIEKDLSRLHETKLEDPVAAGEAWARIAGLTPGDDVAIDTAVKLFESGGRQDLACRVITENINTVDDPSAKVELLARLGTLRLEAGDAAGAAQAYSEAARTSNDIDLWELAETSYLTAKQVDNAVAANAERVRLLSDNPSRQAGLLIKASRYLADAGEDARALQTLFRATELDSESDEFAQLVEKQLQANGRNSDLPAFLLQRAGRLKDPGKRVELRKRAAKVQSHELGDFEAARRSYELVLTESDDAEALTLLADDAENRGDAARAVGYLRRLSNQRDDKKRVPLLLREAHLLHKGLKDFDAAVKTYENILNELDPKNIDALAALAELELQRGKPDKAAEALERQLELADTPELKTDLGVRLADLYESDLDDVEGALRVLQIVHATDPNDFDAVQRICELAERSENWGLLARHLETLIAIEGDEEEVSVMSRRLAAVLHERLERSDDALRYLGVVADRGDEACRQQYVSLADDLGKSVLAATKLVEWYAPLTGSPRRAHALHGAFKRFVDAREDQKVIEVAKELAKTRSADADIAEPLERVAIKAGDLDALHFALELKVRDLSGVQRAEEMVRQAEVLVAAGLEPSQALQHGERALSSVAPDRVEPLLHRLSTLAPSIEHKIDVYERQTLRCKGVNERLFALSRAAQVASEQGDLERSRKFFDQALSSGVPDGGLEVLEKAARASDAGRGNRDTTLRTVLAEALAAGGQGPGDAGRVRSSLLRRAALLAHRDLNDHERAFAWLADALVTHVDQEVLDSLNELALDLGDHSHAESVLGIALDEIFDVPSVRQLLLSRAALRKNHLNNAHGAAEDLKRLHDLAPNDESVLEQLQALYSELKDYRSLVQLYENQILRGRDPNARAETARQVALLWRDKLNDPRETADAWRRVLRMKPGDEEAKEGLARAKRALPYRRTVSSPARERPSKPQMPAATARRSAVIDMPEQREPLTPPVRSPSGLDLGNARSRGLDNRPLDDEEDPYEFSDLEDEEVRDEDLALDDDVDSGLTDPGLNGDGDGLDLEIEVDDEDEDDADAVTTVDQRELLRYAEAGQQGGLRPPPALGARQQSPLAGSSTPTGKRKRSRKRTTRSTADTGVHRKPNVSRRSRKP